MREWVELSAEGVQALAVVVIAVSVVYGTVRFLRRRWQGVGDPYRDYKELLARSLLLSLEFLVAADVIRTVSLDFNAKSMEMLGALVAIRTFLSLSLEVELEGRWPWHASEPASRVAPVGQNETPERSYARASGLG